MQIYRTTKEGMCQVDGPYDGEIFAKVPKRCAQNATFPRRIIAMKEVTNIKHYNDFKV
jgi:hypothetical protein